MRLQLLAAAAAAVLVLPTMALAQAPAGDPALTAFENICWKTGGDYPAVMKTADGDGWTNAALTAETMPKVSVTDQGAREKNVAGSDLRLLATRGTSAGDVIVRTCTISATGKPSGLLDQAKAWLAVDPANSDATSATYLVTVEDGKIRPLTQDELNGAVAKGGVHVIKFRQDSNGETLDYTHISK